MGPVNWLAVILAASLAAALGVAWNGPWFRSTRGGARSPGGYGTGLVVALIGAAMLGHAFARIGADTLHAKPWLYWMQSGGVALAFISPAIWLSQSWNGSSWQRRLVDCGYWLTAYLTMGTVFWALG